MRSTGRWIIWISICLVLGLLLAILILYPYKLHKDYNIQSYSGRLEALAKQSLIHNDVPVASILLSDNKVIGQGFNTVVRDTNPSGHAEINALKDAMKTMGIDKFKAMDRNNLVLISTFEPCPMCKGALNEYNISNVVFDLGKPFHEKYKQFKKQVKYKLHLRESGNGRLQYDLFKLHPDFDSTKYRY